MIRLGTTLFICLFVSLCRPSARDVHAQSPKTAVTTYTFKRVGDLEIKVDVLRAADDVIRPVVVSIHGGALIMGHREQINRPMRERLLDAGYVIASIDYRLAPETKLPVIIEDVADACSWIRREGPELFHADTQKIAVIGGSAGGYLTLMTGFRVQPRPTVLVSFYGYGDLLGDWYTQPSPHPRHNREPVSLNRALTQVGGRPISDDRERQGNGGLFYNYCRQTGEWPQRVSGWNPDSEAEKYTPYLPVKNVTAEYPPTLLIHGSADTDVPYEQSVLMAKQFQRHGVEHRLITLQDGEHGFGGADPKLIEAAYDAAFTFLDSHMKNQPENTGSPTP